MGRIVKNLWQKFTLIEMLVVIAIIAILAAILMPSLQSAVDAARGVTCQNCFRQIGLAFHQFADEYQGRAPAGGDKLFGSTNSASWHHLLNNTVLKDLPKIPRMGPPAPGMLACPNAGYTYASGRSLKINKSFTVGSVRLEIPVPQEYATGDPADSKFVLGASLSKSKHPSKLMLVIDAQPSGSDGFGYSASLYNDCILLPASSSYNYNKIGDFGFRHSSGQNCSVVYVDGHTQLIPALPEFFTYKNFNF